MTWKTSREAWNNIWFSGSVSSTQMSSDFSWGVHAGDLTYLLPWWGEVVPVHIEGFFGPPIFLPHPVFLVKLSVSNAC